MSKCARCGKEEAVWEWPALKVNHYETTSYVNYDTRRVTQQESVSGMINAGLCPECNKALAQLEANDSKLNSLASGMILGGPLITGLSAMEMHLDPKGVPIYIAGGIILVLGIILSAALKKPLLNKRLNAPMEQQCLRLGKISGSDHPRFVPMGDGFYPKLAVFKKVNPNLLSDMSEKIFKEVVSTGSWKTAATADPDSAEAQNPSLSGAQNMVRSLFLDKILEELLKEYRKHPEGFIVSSPEAEAIRKHGETLNSIGGMDLMRQAHARFAQQCNEIGPGLARNLEMVWDGIGEWRG